MTTKEMAEVMLAYANGKQIQAKCVIEERNWIDCEKPKWDWTHYDYRVKPEEPKGEYRPFTYEEACEYIGSVMVSNDKKQQRLIYSVQKMDTYVQINGMSAEYVLAIFTFLNGTPFGMKVEKKETAPMLNDVNKMVSMKINKCCKTCKHNDDGTADPLNGLCVNCENFNN